MVDIDTLPACDWVHTYNRVRSLDRLATDVLPHLTRLLEGIMHGGQALQISLEAGAEG